MKASMCAIAALLVAAAATTCTASIDQEPVRVTYKNSGPMYELADFDKQPAREQQEQSQPQPQPLPTLQQASPFFNMPFFAPSKPSRDDTDDNAERQSPPAALATSDDAPLGAISIRRLVLVPVSSANDDDESEFPARIAPRWPFATGGLMHRHILGADSASRSPFDARARNELAADASRSKAVQSPPADGDAEAPVIDPYMFMMSLLRHAFESRMREGSSAFGQSPASGLATNLSKDEMAIANSEPAASNSGEREKEGATSGAKVNAITTNETSSDIVDIDGQKFVRKTVVQKHVAPGVVFITRRLIFSPANETDATSNPPAPSTAVPPTEAAAPTTVVPNATTGDGSSIAPTIESGSPTAPPTTNAPKAESALEKEGSGPKITL